MCYYVITSCVVLKIWFNISFHFKANQYYVYRAIITMLLFILTRKIKSTLQLKDIIYLRNNCGVAMQVSSGLMLGKDKRQIQLQLVLQLF